MESPIFSKVRKASVPISSKLSTSIGQMFLGFDITGLPIWKNSLRSPLELPFACS